MSAPPPTSPADLAGRWPVIGRGPLLASVRHALADTGAVLVGPAGAGKTTLAEQAVPRPAGRIVGSQAGRHQPLWALRALAPDAATIDDAAADAASLLRKAHRGEGAPVLRIDDLDDLDDASAAVVLRLVLADEARVLATRRPGPAPATVASLWREGGLARIEVPPLDEDDTAALTREALGGLLDGRAGAAVWSLSGGSPQVVRDIVVASVTSGALRCTDGFWRLVGPPAIGGPTKERIEAQVAQLDADERGALEALALTGTVPLALAEHLAPAPVLEALERHGQIAVDLATSPPRVALADPATNVVLTSGLPALARRRLSAAAAAAFDAAGAGRAADTSTGADGPAVDPDLRLRATVWRVDAGGSLSAADLVAAARQAVDQRDTVLGERLAELAVAAGGGAEAVLLQSWCADEHGSTAASLRALAAYEPDDDEERVALAIRRAELEHWVGRDPAAARARLADVAATAGDPWHLAPQAQCAVFAALDGRPLDALDDAEPLLPHPEPLVGSTAALAATIALATTDRPERAQRVAEDAMARLAEAAPGAALFIDPGVHIIGLLFALQGQGRLAEADQLATDVYRHTLTRPGHQAQGWAAMLRSYLLLARGRPAEAAEAAQEAELVWDSARLQGPARWSATIAALALGEAGDLDGATLALARVDARDGTGFLLFEPEVHRARAWVALRRGEDPRPALDAAITLAEARGLQQLVATAAHDLVRVGHPEHAATVLGRLAAPGEVSRARTELAGAAAAGDADRLEGVGWTFERFGALGWAAEARALAVAVDRRRAPDLRPRVAKAVEGTGLATPPLVAMATEPVVPPPASALTAREAEVARLAAGGLANREIAEQLVVSLRTVENHLHRAFAKLGVTNRAELADHLPTT